MFWQWLKKCVSVPFRVERWHALLTDSIIMANNAFKLEMG